MKKDEYQLASFQNIQELIRFTDQKVAAILVVLGLMLSVYVGKANELVITLEKVSLYGIFAFLSGLSFLACVLFITYISIIKILKPGFAENYPDGAYSCFYFGHIATGKRDFFRSEVQKLVDTRQIDELTDQIFEISKILNRKNRNCAKVMNILFLSILLLVIFMLSSTRVL